MLFIPVGKVEPLAVEFLRLAAKAPPGGEKGLMHNRICVLGSFLMEYFCNPA